jgi:hypothetical protein
MAFNNGAWIVNDFCRTRATLYYTYTTDRASGHKKQDITT